MIALGEFKLRVSDPSLHSTHISVALGAVALYQEGQNFTAKEKVLLVLVGQWVSYWPLQRQETSAIARWSSPAQWRTSTLIRQHGP